MFILRATVRVELAYANELACFVRARQLRRMTHFHIQRERKEFGRSNVSFWTAGVGKAFVRFIRNFSVSIR